FSVVDPGPDHVRPGPARRPGSVRSSEGGREDCRDGFRTTGSTKRSFRAFTGPRDDVRGRQASHADPEGTRGWVAGRGKQNEQTEDGDNGLGKGSEDRVDPAIPPA